MPPWINRDHHARAVEKGLWMRIFDLWRNLFLMACTWEQFSGCANNPKNIDPWEVDTIRGIYKFDDGLDHYVLKPLADGYVKIVPKPVRTKLGNAFDNLGYPNVILSDFLQGKWDQGHGAIQGRMAVNSTIGIAGIFDVAGPWGMKSHDIDFGITLGKWGVPAGPYMVLPLFGPSCVRDVPGIGVGIATNPLTWVGAPLAATITLGVVQAADGRSRADKEVHFRDIAAIDPYVFTRDAYLQFREGQIHEGQPPPKDTGMYDDDTGPDTGATTQTGPATKPATTGAP